MAELTRWSGNTTSKISLYDKELDRLAEFVRNHKRVHIFGTGKIGKGLGHYMKEAQLPFAGYVTSPALACFKKEYVPGECGIIMGVSDRYFPEILPLLGFMDRKDICSLTSEKREEIGRIFSIDSVKENFWINIFTTNQCNLNCKSCSSFAPVCPPDFYGPEQFEKDISKLRGLKLKTISVLKFTGGEPFLHPQIFRMFACARKYFPNIPIECYTNGLAVKGMEDDRLKELAELAITLVITEYPLKNMDLKSLYEKLDRNAVSYCVIYSEGQKYFSKRPLNFTKTPKPHLFSQCPNPLCFCSKGDCISVSMFWLRSISITHSEPGLRWWIGIGWIFTRCRLRRSINIVSQGFPIADIVSRSKNWCHGGFLKKRLRNGRSRV